MQTDWEMYEHDKKCSYRNPFSRNDRNGDPKWKDTYVYATVESDYSI